MAHGRVYRIPPLVVSLDIGKSRLWLANYFFFPAQSREALASFVGTKHHLGLAQKLSGAKSGEITRVEKPRNKLGLENRLLRAQVTLLDLTLI